MTRVKVREITMFEAADGTVWRSRNEAAKATLIHHLEALVTLENEGAGLAVTELADNISLVCQAITDYGNNGGIL